MGTEQKTLCVDFDGVIAKYDKWQGKGIFGSPIPRAIKVIRLLKKEGWKIIVHTTRLEVHQIREYLNGWEIPFDFINHNPENLAQDCHPCKPLADVYLDDRAIQFNGDWAEAYKQIVKFKPWYRRKRVDAV